MGVFSDQEAVEQNPHRGEYMIPRRLVDEEQGHILAAINSGWHEGEGCSVNSCCCDLQGA